MFTLIGNMFGWLERKIGLDEDELILCFLLVLLAFPVKLRRSQKCWIEDHAPQASVIVCQK